MRVRTFVLVLAAASLAVAAPFVSADDKRARGQDKRRGRGHADHDESGPASNRDSKFRSWDKDGDGSISRTEYPGHPGNFRALDTNNDGTLTLGEFQHQAGAGAPAGERASDVGEPAGRDDAFRGLDADNDGALSRGEWRGRSSTFDDLDSNRDGRLSRAEYVRGSARGRLLK